MDIIDYAGVLCVVWLIFNCFVLTITFLGNLARRPQTEGSTPLCTLFCIIHLQQERVSKGLTSPEEQKQITIEIERILLRLCRIHQMSRYDALRIPFHKMPSYIHGEIYNLVDRCYIEAISET